MNAQERAQQQMQEKKKKEMLQKMQEERARRGGPEELPSEGVPGSVPHMRKPGEGADLDVHTRQVRVRAHNRGKPKRNEK